MSSNDDRSDVLARRAKKLASKGEYRKAALALRERVAITGDAVTWVQLGDMLRRARRTDEAARALKEGLWLHKRAGAIGRARTVAKMLSVLVPGDASVDRELARLEAA